MQTFSIKEAFREAWALWKANKKLITITTLILAVVEVVRPEKSVGFGIVNIIFWVISTLLSIGWMKVLLKISRVESANWKEVIHHTSLFWKYVGASILLFLIIALGLVLLIAPGIYWMLKYNFVPTIIIDKNISIREAFKESARMTEGVKWKLLAFFLVSAGVFILGLLIFLIGIIIAAPVATLAYIAVYKKLAKNNVILPLEAV